MRWIPFVVLLGTACASHQDDDDKMTLPAAAAGLPSAAAPGVPSDFSGDFAKTLPLSAEERRSLAEAEQLRQRRWTLTMRGGR